jgi:hypothetical protein
MVQQTALVIIEVARLRGPDVKMPRVSLSMLFQSGGRRVSPWPVLTDRTHTTQERADSIRLAARAIERLRLISNIECGGSSRLLAFGYWLSSADGP